MFVWMLKLLVIVLLSGNDAVSLERTSSTNESPGNWIEQPGTIPICNTSEDADAIARAYVGKDGNGAPDKYAGIDWKNWDAAAARARLSRSVTMEVKSCHFEKLPQGVTETRFLELAILSDQFRDIGFMTHATPDGLRFVSRGASVVVLAQGDDVRWVIFTEPEAVVLSYGRHQYQTGFLDGMETFLAPAEPPQQDQAPESTLSPSARILRDL